MAKVKTLVLTSALLFSSLQASALGFGFGFGGGFGGYRSYGYGNSYYITLLKIKEDNIPAFIEHLTTSHSIYEKDHAFNALSTLAKKSKSNQDLIRNKGGIEAMMKTIARDHGYVYQSSFIALMSVLKNNPENQGVFLSDPNYGFSALANNLNRHCARVRKGTGDVLLALAMENAQVRQRLTQKENLKNTIKLLGSIHFTLKVKGAKILKSLYDNKTNLEALRSSDAVKDLVHELTSHSTRVKVACLETLESVAKNDPESLKKLKKSKTAKRIKKLSKHKKSAIKNPAKSILGRL